MTKSDVYDELEEILEYNSKEDLLKYLFDYFSKQNLIDLLKHIKEEKQ